DDPSLCFGAGLAAFMLGRDALAQASFECALARNPGFLPAARWLADLHYRTGRLEEAIAIFEAARERVSDARDLEEQLARWRRELDLEEQFGEVSSQHFTVRFEGTVDERIAREIA